MNVSVHPFLAARVADGWHRVSAVRYRLEVRLTPADVGKRVVIRWRRPSPVAGKEIADVWAF